METLFQVPDCVWQLILWSWFVPHLLFQLWVSGSFLCRVFGLQQITSKYVAALWCEQISTEITFFRFCRNSKLGRRNSCMLHIPQHGSFLCIRKQITIKEPYMDLRFWPWASCWGPLCFHLKLRFLHVQNANILCIKVYIFFSV